MSENDNQPQQDEVADAAALEQVHRGQAIMAETGQPVVGLDEDGNLRRYFPDRSSEVIDHRGQSPRAQ